MPRVADGSQTCVMQHRRLEGSVEMCGVCAEHSFECAATWRKHPEWQCEKTTPPSLPNPPAAAASAARRNSATSPRAGGFAEPKHATTPASTACSEARSVGPPASAFAYGPPPGTVLHHERRPVPLEQRRRSTAPTAPLLKRPTNYALNPSALLQIQIMEFAQQHAGTDQPPGMIQDGKSVFKGKLANANPTKQRKAAATADAVMLGAARAVMPDDPDAVIGLAHAAAARRQLVDVKNSEPGPERAAAQASAMDGLKLTSAASAAQTRAVSHRPGLFKWPAPRKSQR